MPTGQSACRRNLGQTPQLNFTDCAIAVRIWSLQVAPLGKKPFESLAKDTKGTTFETWQYTPVNYTHKSCTLAIVMEHDLSPLDLDVPPKMRFPTTDIATYFHLKLAVKAVFTERIDLRARPERGWWSIGRKASVGLFMWAAGSQMDKK
ncbi:MAG: hypothetical protein Q9224_005514, partial [Gallowayella concinna]